MSPWNLSLTFIRDCNTTSEMRMDLPHLSTYTSVHPFIKMKGLKRRSHR